MLVETVMSAPAITIGPLATVGDAARLMLAKHISGLPVVSADGALVGILSEGDCLRRVELGTERKRSWWLEFLASPGKIADEYVHSHGRMVEEVMTRDVVTTQMSATLHEAVETMLKHRIKRMPVLANGKIVGIVARSDILRMLARNLPKNSIVLAGDGQIRADILAELAKQPWSSGGQIHVNVKNGSVSLSGTIFDERQRLAVKVAAENVPGVKSVSEQLVWVEPISPMGV